MQAALSAVGALPAPRFPAKTTQRQGGRLQAARLQASNGSAPGAEATRQAVHVQPAVEMLEMVVADDLLVSGDQVGRGPTKRLVPAPHMSAPAVAARPKSADPAAAPTNGSNGGNGTNGGNGANGLSGGSGGSSSVASPIMEASVNGLNLNGGGLLSGLNGSRGLNGAAPINGASSSLAPPAVVQQLVSLQNSNKMVTSELSVAQRQVAQQQMEMKVVRTELAQRDAEVVSLKQELAEKDGKLKAARTDALESKMRLQHKDAELKEAYAQLSEAVRDRSAMRSQLAQTHAELAETRAELEALADDILAIKLLMDDGEAYDGEASDPADSVAGLLPAPLPSAGGAYTSEDDTMDVLESLAALSRQLAADAAEDDAIVRNMASSWSEGAPEEQQAAGWGAQ